MGRKILKARKIYKMVTERAKCLERDYLLFSPSNDVVINYRHDICTIPCDFIIGFNGTFFPNHPFGMRNNDTIEKPSYTDLFEILQHLKKQPFVRLDLKKMELVLK